MLMHYCASAAIDGTAQPQPQPQPRSNSSYLDDTQERSTRHSTVAVDFDNQGQQYTLADRRLLVLVKLLTARSTESLSDLNINYTVLLQTPLEGLRHFYYQTQFS